MERDNEMAISIVLEGGRDREVERDIEIVIRGRAR